ncbi:hypothetical protein BDV98DRAFT_571383 [Pterulicium gracile]|uniref:Secreted protein n=1 Tax=Pterulicium gracile TaxID=1884261 RepID=A0A5C3QLR3_9AGAR|nr:hypothetical protein BDV98DRAFT_571383 [Pterula gracilis]
MRRPFIQPIFHFPLVLSPLFPHIVAKQSQATPSFIQGNRARRFQPPLCHRPFLITVHPRLPQHPIPIYRHFTQAYQAKRRWRW